MIVIFTTPALADRIKAAIAKEDRLDELVHVSTSGDNPKAAEHFISVNEKGITCLPDWYNQLPPVLFGDNLVYSDETLLGIVFCLLCNFEKSQAYLMNDAALWETVDLLSCLLNDIELDHLFEANVFKNPAFLHNKAIAFQYGQWQEDRIIRSIQAAFEEALQYAGSPELKAFTVKHYATFLVDSGQPGLAIQVVEEYLSASLSPDAHISLKTVLCNAWMHELIVPYNQQLVDRLKTTLWECIQYYELHNHQAEAALLFIDASHIANISNSFTESLGYINKAIGILQNADLPSLVGSAQLRKGMLLYTWAQNGQPQFYRTALQSLQEALAVFDREAAPDVFADIHHHLGVIYSEIQDEVKKKAVWAAVSVSSFTEALNFYNKVDYPYEFAMICHNFGNAYFKYPAALHSDNYDKALAWYREALDIRTAETYPLERCNTITNYLEASWLAANPDEEFNEERFNEMWSLAHELRSLTQDFSLKQEASNHIEKLIQVKASFVG